MLKVSNQPIVDITTLCAVESLFRSKSPDPWAQQLAGDLADFIVYADIARYVLPTPTLDASEDDVPLPSLLQELRAGEPSAFRAQRYSTEEPRMLKSDYLEPCFRRFVSWAQANTNSLRLWSELHHEDWIISGHKSRVAQHYVYSVDVLKHDPRLSALAHAVGVSANDLCYAFDLILRYPLYGEMAGERNYYLNHPIRNAFPLPTMEYSAAPAPPITVSFKKSFSTFAHQLTQNDYVTSLLELRYAVRKAGLHELVPGKFKVDTIREIASRVGIPPRLASKWTAIAGGIIGGIGLIPTLGPWAAIPGVASVAVSFASALWKGCLPRRVARIRWLRWAIEWDDLERQAAEAAR